MLYTSRGTISEMSEVTTGQTKSGNPWQRMTLVLDIPGYQGSVTKQAFQVFNDDVKEVSLLNIGDKVGVSWSMYARQWNGRWYNNVDLAKIKHSDNVVALGFSISESHYKHGENLKFTVSDFTLTDK